MSSFLVGSLIPNRFSIRWSTNRWMSSSSSSSTVMTLAAVVGLATTYYYWTIHHRPSKKIMLSSAMMRDPICHIFSTQENVSQALCAWIVQQAQKAIADRGIFYWAIHGGSIAQFLSKLKGYSQSKNIAAKKKDDDGLVAAVDWSKVVLCLMENHHHDTNNTNNQSLEDQCKASFANELGIHQFVTLHGVQNFTTTNTTTTTASLPRRNQNGVPIFDLILLDRQILVQNHNNNNNKKQEEESRMRSLEIFQAARQVSIFVCGGEHACYVQNALKRPPRESCHSIQWLDAPIFFLDEEAAAATGI